MPGTKRAESIVDAWLANESKEAGGYSTDGQHIYYYAACMLADYGGIVVINNTYYSPSTSNFQRVIRNKLETTNTMFFVATPKGFGRHITSSQLWDTREAQRMEEQYGTPN